MHVATAAAAAASVCGCHCFLKPLGPGSGVPGAALVERLQVSACLAPALCPPAPGWTLGPLSPPRLFCFLLFWPCLPSGGNQPLPSVRAGLATGPQCVALRWESLRCTVAKAGSEPDLEAASETGVFLAGGSRAMGSFQAPVPAARLSQQQ